MPSAPSSSANPQAPVHFVVPYGESNASVRVRVFEWIERLAPSDLDRVAVWGPSDRRGSPPAGETTVLLRNRARLSRGRRERRLLERAQLGVYELDDGLPWDDGRLPDLGRWWKRPFPRSQLAAAAAAAADRIIVGNEVLADWASDRCRDVRVIPTCVEPSRYRRRDAATTNDGTLVIGWIGSPATQHYLEDVAGSIQAVAARRPVRVEIIGAVESRLPPALADLATVRPWAADEAYTRLATWSVGIMPLRDGPYERAKCGYKLLQYAAAGIPAVGSPIGANREILASMAGAAPATADEWVDALRSVADAGDAERRAWSDRAAATAAAYSFTAWQDRWMAATGIVAAEASCTSDT